MVAESVDAKKQELHRIVDTLPPERLDAAQALLHQLGQPARVDLQQGRQVVRLGGLWKDRGVLISEEEIDQARREMWGRLGEETQ